MKYLLLICLPFIMAFGCARVEHKEKPLEEATAPDSMNSTVSYDTVKMQAPLPDKIGSDSSVSTSTETSGSGMPEAFPEILPDHHFGKKGGGHFKTWHRVGTETNTTGATAAPFPPPTQAMPEEQKNPDEIKQGLLDYNIPKQMSIQHAYTISFTVNRDTSDKSTIQQGDTHVTIPTTPTMQVELVDPMPASKKAFDITIANTEKVQMVDMQGHTDWNYTVIPLRTGNHVLNVVVSIIRNNNKKQAVYANAVMVHTDVPVQVKSFIEKYWQWILSTLLIPFVVWVWKERHEKIKAK